MSNRTPAEKAAQRSRTAANKRRRIERELTKNPRNVSARKAMEHL